MSVGKGGKENDFPVTSYLEDERVIWLTVFSGSSPQLLAPRQKQLGRTAREHSHCCPKGGEAQKDGRIQGTHPSGSSLQ